MLIDTERHIRGTPRQIVFCLSPYFILSGSPSFILERGAHKPSTAESLAPFHQDPTQRIIVLNIPFIPNYLVLRVGALLELLKDREGTEVGWDEWKTHAAILSFPPSGAISHAVQVSGSRFFHIYSTAPDLCSQMEVYDFSMQGRAKYLSKREFRGLGAINHMSSTGAKARVPFRVLFGLHIGHDSIMFYHVSATVFCAF